MALHTHDLEKPYVRMCRQEDDARTEIERSADSLLWEIARSAGAAQKFILDNDPLDLLSTLLHEAAKANNPTLIIGLHTLAEGRI